MKPLPILLRSFCSASCLIAVGCLLTVGCENQRLKPEDFPRRDPTKTSQPGKTADASKSAVSATNKKTGSATNKKTASETNKKTASETNEPMPSPETSEEDRYREAAMQGDLAAVKTFLTDGMDVNAAGPQGRIGLQLAAFDGHTEVVKFLLDRKAKVDHRDQFGRTALMYAATGANVETVDLLLNAGADPNAVDQEENFSPIMFAAAEGQLAVVKRLLESKADATLKDIDGETALDFARNNKHAEVVALLTK